MRNLWPSRRFSAPPISAPGDASSAARRRTIFRSRFLRRRRLETPRRRAGKRPRRAAAPELKSRRR